MILTLQLYSPSITNKIYSNYIKTQLLLWNTCKNMCITKKKKKKKGKQSPHTKTWVSFKNKLFVSPAPEAAEAAGLFQWERACTEGCKASTLPDQGQSEHTREWLCFAFPFLLLVLTHPKSSLPLWDFSFFDTSTLAYGKMLLSNVIQTCQGTHEAKRMLTLFMNMWFVFIHMLVNKKKNNCFQEIKTHLN